MVTIMVIIIAIIITLIYLMSNTTQIAATKIAT